MVDSTRIFSFHWVLAICVGREDEQHAARLFYGLDDRLSIVHSREHIAWRNPATNTLRFERSTRRVRGQFIGDCVAYKYVQSHGNAGTRKKTLVASIRALSV